MCSVAAGQEPSALTRVQSVSVLCPLHPGLQAECWPLHLLFYSALLMLLVSSAAGENTANSQKPLSCSFNLDAFLTNGVSSFLLNLFLL